jgi:dihydrofolate synthase/folylpolyglutamate synthase
MPTKLKALRELETLLNAAIPSFRWSSQVNLKLERIQSLVELLGNPQTSYSAIHIGGTSGKGTVAAMTASILSHHGRLTGLHLSPYVQTLTETWRLDGRYSLPSRILPVARLVTETAENIPLMPASGPVSYFELNVAIALKLFAEERVDTAIIEVGLGGARDATNVISADVAVLTNVGLDHTEVLGDTVEKLRRVASSW